MFKSLLPIPLLVLTPIFACSEQPGGDDSVQVEFLSAEQSDNTLKFRMRLTNQSNDDVCFTSFNDLTKQNWIYDSGGRLSFSSEDGEVLEPLTWGEVWPLDTVVEINRVLRGNSVQFSIHSYKDNYLFIGGDTYQVEVQFGTAPCDIFTADSITLGDLERAHSDNRDRRLVLTDSYLVIVE